jgi:hypothetical protein
LRSTLGGNLGFVLFLSTLQQTCAQHLHRFHAVLQLTALVLHGYHQTRGLVRDSHGRVGGVDALATRSAGSVHVNLEVALVDGDVHFLGFGHHGNRCR